MEDQQRWATLPAFCKALCAGAPAAQLDAAKKIGELRSEFVALAERARMVCEAELQSLAPASREAAANVLRSMGMAAEDSAEALAAALGDEAPEVRLAAAAALGRLGPLGDPWLCEAGEVTASLLESADCVLQIKAALAGSCVGRVGGCSKASGALAAAAVTHEDPQVRFTVAQALAEVSAAEASHARSAAALLGDDDSLVACAAAEALAAIVFAQPSATRYLRAAAETVVSVLSSPEPQERVAAAQAAVALLQHGSSLGNLQETLAVRTAEVASAELQGDTPRVVAQAAAAVLSLEPSLAGAHFAVAAAAAVSFLENSSPEVRLAAAQALSALRSSTHRVERRAAAMAGEQLLALKGDPKDLVTLEDAATALSLLGQGAGPYVECLTKHLHHRRAVVRRAVGSALAAGGLLGKAELTGALRSADWKVRTAAARSLDPSSAEKLRERRLRARTELSDQG